MKKILIFLPVLLLTVFSALSKPGDPIVVEILTTKTSVSEALEAAKNTLLASKFITTNGVQETSFTATRTTGSKADYYVADVKATKADGKVKLTITFVKVGSGFLSLKKVAAEVKSKLEQP